MSFYLFSEFNHCDDISDSQTVWFYRERLIDLDLIEPLFNLFLKELERLNLVVNEGIIVDSSFIKVPTQRNTRDENKQIKEIEVPESFKQNLHRLA